MRYTMMFLFLFAFACKPDTDDSVDADTGLDADVEAETDADADAEIDADVDEDPLPTCDYITEDSDREHVLACCLTERGAVLYHTYWCTYCYVQQRMFRSYFHLVNNVECWNPNTGEIPECTALGIEGYPAWTFLVYDEETGEPTDEILLVEGLMYYTDLAEYSGCV